VRSALPTYELDFDEDGTVCTIDFRDRFVAENIFVVIGHLKKDPRYEVLQGVVWNLRHADLSSLTLSELKDIFTRQKQMSPSKFLRVACVISSDVDSYILKLWQDIRLDANPNQRRWFFNMEDARVWVRSE
jgi:hypothetical protein